MSMLRRGCKGLPFLKFFEREIDRFITDYEISPNNTRWLREVFFNRLLFDARLDIYQPSMRVKVFFLEVERDIRDLLQYKQFNPQEIIGAYVNSVSLLNKVCRKMEYNEALSEADRERLKWSPHMALKAQLNLKEIVTEKLDAGDWTDFVDPSAPEDCKNDELLQPLGESSMQNAEEVRNDIQAELLPSADKTNASIPVSEDDDSAAKEANGSESDNLPPKQSEVPSTCECSLSSLAIMSYSNEFDSSDDESPEADCSAEGDAGQENPPSVLSFLKDTLRVRMIRKKTRRIVVSTKRGKSPLSKVDYFPVAVDPKWTWFGQAITLYSCAASRFAQFRSNRRFKPGD